MSASPINMPPAPPAPGGGQSATGASAAGNGKAATGAADGQNAAAGFEGLLASLFAALGAQPGGKADAKDEKTDAKADGAGDPDAAAAQAESLAAALFFAPPATLAQPAPTGQTADAEAGAAVPGQGDAAAALFAKLNAGDDAATAPEPNAADAAPTAQKPQLAAPAAQAAAEAPAAPAPPPPPVADSALAAAVAAAAEEPAPQPPADKSKVAVRGRVETTTEAAPGGQPAAADQVTRAPVQPVNTAPVVGEKPQNLATLEPGKPEPGEKDSLDAPDFTPHPTAAGHAGSAAEVEAQRAPVRGAPETVASLAADILKKFEGKSTRFDVQLDPAGLGKVDVRVEIGAQGRLTASLSFDNPQAAAELRSRSGELQRALEQAGFDLSGGLNFSSGDQDRSGQWLASQQQQQQQQQQQGGDGWRGRAFQAALDVAVDVSDAAATVALQLQRQSSTGVDIRI